MIFYVTADTATGVYLDEGEDYDLMQQDDFYAALPYLAAGDVIHAAIDDVMRERIEHDYGINNY